MTNRIEKYEAEFRRKLTAARNLHYKEQIGSGAIIGAGCAVIVALFSSAVEALFAYGTTGRTLLLLLGILICSASAAWFVLRPILASQKLLHSLSELDIADRVGILYPQIKDHLRNVLELSGAGKSVSRYEYSPEMIEAAAKELHEASSNLPFIAIVSFTSFKRNIRWCAALLVVAAILFGTSATGLGEAGRRILHCSTKFHHPYPFTIRVQPGNTEVVKGLPVSISADLVTANQSLSFRMPTSVRLRLQLEGVTVAEDVSLAADSTGRFVYAIPSAKQSFRYSVSAAEMQSDEYRIAVVDRPYVRSMKVVVTSPVYAHTPAISLDDNVGDVAALAGSRVHWTILSNKKLSSASVLCREGKKIPCTMNGTSVTAQAVFRQSTSYHIALTDVTGNTSINPIEYKIDITADEVPGVAITQPGRNVDITDATTLPMHFKLHDDYGISALRIAYRLIQSKYEKPQEQFTYVQIPIAPGGRSAAGMTGFDLESDHTWNLAPLALVPEDVVEYRAEVFDNDVVSGPKMGVSDTYILRLPSFEEVFADADKAQNSAVKNLNESLQQAEEFKKDVEKLAREMKKSQPPDWQQQQRATELARKYEDLQKKVDQVNRTVDEMAQQLQKNNVLSQETMQKYMELQQMMQQLDLKEFQEAMKRLQSSMQNFSPDQLKEAMQKVQFTEEAFRKSIERTLNLLKRIQVEQKVDEMVRRAEQLQEQQEALQKETAKADPQDKAKAKELAQKQRDINRDLQELQKHLSELRTKMEEFAKEMPMNELEKAEQAANDEEMEKSMEQSEQQLQAQQPQQAQESQQKASKKMQKMTQQMSRMQQQLLAKQIQETMAALRRAMKDLLQISQKEEALKNETQRSDPNSPRLREKAETQQDVQNDLRNVTNGLAELSQKSFIVTPEMGKSIGDALAHMNQAVMGLDQRNGGAAGQEQIGAMASLNQAAQLVQDAMQSMQQDGAGAGGGSLMQQLRRMTGQQQGINMQTQQMGSGMSQAQMQQAGRLAVQQDALRKSMEQLNKEAQSSNERSRILGDLQRIADEMREVVADMEQNNVNPNTLRQQEKILSRMLEAQSSLRERDFEQRRRSVSGKAPVRSSPATLSSTAETDKLRRDLIKALEEGYTKDYQELIRRYFEAVGAKEPSR
ncbi:MAG: hypothetical protein NTV54_11435 [Ignavibacteriales bacterium]|nr:hypothetical protein [Ignavibacteriales bacterium]